MLQPKYNFEEWISKNNTSKLLAISQVHIVPHILGETTDSSN